MFYCLLLLLLEKMFVADTLYKIFPVVCGVLLSIWMLYDFTVRINGRPYVQIFGKYQQIQSEDRNVKLILVTSFRGGSSFLGELFNQNPDVLYWFEPLHPIFFAAKKEYNLYSEFGAFELDKDNITCRKLPEDYVKRLSSTLKRLLDCDLAPINESVILQNPFIKYNRLYPLIVPYYGNKTLRSDVVAMLRDGCLRYKHRVIKSIRVSLYMIRSLLDTDQSVRIIYYVRDPRATINSRLRYMKDEKLMRSGPFETEVTRLCCRLADERRQYEAIVRDHPDRVLLLKFEDLALRPLATARVVYGDYLGLTMPESVGRWLADNTTHPSSSLFSTRRLSSEIVDKWRKQLNGSIRREVERKCYHILKLYNYI